jgi:hypothetical protein
MFRQQLQITLLIALILVVGIGGFFYFEGKEGNGPMATSTSATTSSPKTATGDTITLALGEAGVVNGVTITPREVLEDSRCAKDVQCVWAGRVRVRATLSSGLGTADQEFLVGEPVTTEAEAVTLLSADPAPVSTRTIAASEYRFTFKAVKQGYSYTNATTDLVAVDAPTPGAVVGKTFVVKGKARGTWYFEASFPVDILDKNGRQLASVPAQAEGDWMTENFVPFTASITVADSYVGPATVVLHKDNPSGDPSKDASVSYPITIEY